MHLDCSVGNVNDRHKFQEERPPKDIVVPNVEADHLKYQHLPALVSP
jgi:hypothetical protein